eukprot:scaffold239398_cov17-Prasinocladus_malaysianus.AAC.2
MTAARNCRANQEDDEEAEQRHQPGHVAECSEAPRYPQVSRVPTLRRNSEISFSSYARSVTAGRPNLRNNFLCHSSAAGEAMYEYEYRRSISSLPYDY